MDVTGQSFGAGVPPEGGGVKRAREEGAQISGPKRARTSGPLADLHALTEDFKSKSIADVTKVMNALSQEIESGRLGGTEQNILKRLKHDIKFVRDRVEDREDVSLVDKNALLGKMSQILTHLKPERADKMEGLEFPQAVLEIADPTKVYMIDLCKRDQIVVENDALKFSDEIASSVDDQFLKKVLENVPFKLAEIKNFDLERSPKLSSRSIGMLLTHCPNLQPESFKALATQSRFWDLTLVVEGKDFPVNKAFMEKKCPDLWNYLADFVETGASRAVVQLPISGEALYHSMRALLGVYNVQQEQEFSALATLIHAAGVLGASSLITRCDEVLAQRVTDALTSEQTPFERKVEVFQRVRDGLGGHLTKIELPKVREALEKVPIKLCKSWVQDRARLERLDLDKEELSQEEMVHAISLVAKVFDAMRSSGVAIQLSADTFFEKVMPKSIMRMMELAFHKKIS